ncbi:hypothetical protein Pla175_35800 [Pirellulimonas nuda]|uniref:Type II secretion system protein G n=1 Tax=Pirellulimonas nuda TaxID=2528009 RepID=A0A518DFE5_9BACT|nr:type II secretion system protein [Pirellulimonas nuda]QDU90178.1 hypothetical protein Pla175_35800 [Pirellulimonas nuda]
MNNQPARAPLARHSSLSTHHSAFTLVELLVVITIIGILAGLITVAAVNAMKAAARTRIKAEINSFDQAIEDDKNNSGGVYPPNCQTDGAGPVDETAVYNELRRYLAKRFPRSREPDGLVRALAGVATSGNPNLPGGMTGSEAVVFWLGGFSSDVNFPISGEGGPSYIDSANLNSPMAQADPIENRRWALGIKPEQLAPRDPDGYFDQTDNRYLVYPDPTFNGRSRRINFWSYLAPGSPQPLVYMAAPQVSGLTLQNDPPAAGPAVAFSGQASDWSQLQNVYAIKRTNPTANIQNSVFANAGKFQILHCGIDHRWGVLPQVNASGVSPLLYPAGPFAASEYLADTLTNFTDSTLEDSQP